MSNAVVLLGNGLSVAANPALSLDRLTDSFLESHGDDRENLDRLLAEVNLRDLDPTRDFEGIVAGLEAAEEVISAFMALAATSAHSDLQEAASLLRDRGVPALVRRLYFAYCSEILDSISDAARIDLPEAIRDFGEWLRALYRAHHSMALFTLNYDVLLERLLISEDLLGLRNALTDFFSGWPSRMETVQLVAGGMDMEGHYFYPEDPPSRPIHLHHLHGCLTHFRRDQDGAVLKFDASSLRTDRTFERLAATESSDFTPSVILGSKKVNKAREWPFSFAFLELERRAHDARTVVIGGYSFRDSAVNVRLQAAAQSGERRWIVVNRKNGSEAAEFRREVDRLLSPATPEYVLDGFGGTLPEPE